jgi:hypothetical protein
VDTTVTRPSDILPPAALPFTTAEFESRTPASVLAEEFCTVAGFLEAEGYLGDFVAEFSRLSAQRRTAFDGHTEATCALLLP